MTQTKDSMNLWRQIAVVVAVIVTIVVNVLANALPINGLTTGQVAQRFDVLFQPAAYVFSIWGLIYLGLAAYAIYQVRPAVRNDPQLRSLDLPFLISSAANVAWILVWHFQQIVASFVIILVLLGSLIAIYRRLGQGCTVKTRARVWTVDRVFSVYLGWVTVASFANLGAMLDHLGWTGSGLGEVSWFMIGVVALLLVGASVAWARSDVAYLLVLVWAFIGIGVERAGSPMVSTIAWTTTAVLGALVVVSALRASALEPEYGPGG